MANNSRTNPMYADSVGGLVNPNTVVTVVGIAILASNATWAITIQDGAGNTLYHASNTAGSAGIPPRSFTSTGLAVTTITNCTTLIYMQ